MRPIRLQFAQTPAGPGAASLALLFAGAVALGVTLWHFSARQAERNELAAALQAREAVAGRDTSSQDASRGRQAADVSRAAAVLAGLVVPWAGLFSALESAAAPGVVLTGLVPEVDARRVRISGEAREFDQIADYARRLQQTQTFSGVTIVSHETREKRIGFTLQADWVATP
jgi:Tfp pilus assembly protein PilN